MFNDVIRILEPCETLKRSISSDSGCGSADELPEEVAQMGRASDSIDSNLDSEFIFNEQELQWDVSHDMVLHEGNIFVAERNHRNQGLERRLST